MKLQDVCEVYSGYALKEFNDSEEGYPVIKIGNICLDGTIDLEKCQYTTDSVNEKYYSEKGDIYVALSGATTGKIGIMNTADKYIINQRVGIVRKLDKEISDQYIKYFLMNKTEKILEDASGCAQPNISPKQIGQYEFPRLDYSDMNQISEILDKVSDVIIQRKLELQKLDELIKARFVELFGDPEENQLGWEKAPLSSVIVNANNGMARRGNDIDGNIVMRLVELQDGYIDYSNPNRIKLNDNEKKRYLLREKDFLFARVNGNPDNVGRCAVFYDIGEEVYHNDHIIRVHFDEEVLDGAFASALFNSDYGKRQLKSQIKTSAGQYTVSQDGIGAIVSILPPMTLQKQFAKFVHQVDKSKFVHDSFLKYIEMVYSILCTEDMEKGDWQ